MEEKPTKSIFRQTENRLQQIKEAFEENHDLINLVFERMPIGICITDEDGIFVNINEAYTEVYGYTKEELVGKPFTTVVPKDKKQELQKLHDQFIQGEKELRGHWQVLSKNGEVLNILSTAALICDKKNGTSFKMTFVVKTHNEDDAHDQLEHTVKVLEHKIEAQESAMSLTEHDIRKNIGAMVTVADMMINMERSDKDKKWLKMIKRSGYDTLDLLQATEDYVSMEKGVYEKKRETFDAVVLIKKIRSAYNDLIKSKNNELLIDIPKKYESKPLEVSADLFYFRRMITNLITNALEASSKNTAVSVKFTINKYFEIHVHNNGVIPEDIRDNFFEKYITSGKSTGTGLGTYIAKLIAEVHDGTIDFETSEENGTALKIMLPKSMLVNKSGK